LNEFKKYLRIKKVEWLHKIHEDFHRETGIDLPHGHGFTRSDFCHFVAYEGKKFVHKGAMKFILTNGDTYSVHEKLQDTFEQKTIDKKKIDDNVEKMFNFFRHEINGNKLFPRFLEETENFFIFQFYETEDWTPLEELTIEDSSYIRKIFLEFNKGKKEIVSPFFNQMVNKLFRHQKTGEIVMIDLKGLEFHPNGPLSILMNNGYVNDLYLLERRYWTKSYILKPYSLDYSVAKTRLIKHY